jgi:hypothetical protein
MRRHLLTGEREAGEGEIGEARQFGAAVGEHPRRLGEVGQPGPGVRDLRVARPGQRALPKVADHHLVEPVARRLVVEEIPRPQQDHRQAGSAQALFHLDPHPPEPVAGAVRRVGAEELGRALAKDIDVARLQDGRAGTARGVDEPVGERGHLSLPARVGHVPAVDDHVGALGGGAQAGAATEERDLPAGVPEGLRHVAAEPSVAAQNEDLARHVTLHRCLGGIFRHAGAI